MNLINHIASNAVNHQPTAFTVLLAAIGSGIATALEWLPAVVGTLTSIIGLAAGIAILYHTILSIKLINRKLKGREERNGEHTRRDD